MLEQFNHIFSIPAFSLVLVGLVGSIGYSLKALPVKVFVFLKTKFLSRFLFTAHVYDYDEMFNLLEIWLAENYQVKYKDVSAHITSVPNNKIPSVQFKQAPNMFYIIHMGKKIIIEKKRKEITHATNSFNMFYYEYVITGIHAKEQVASLFKLVISDYYASFPTNTVSVKVHDEAGIWHHAGNITVKPIDKIVLPATQKGKIVKDLDEFVKAKEWYMDVCVPYKRTYCFEGPPGTGKTTICLSMAAYLQREVYMMNLNAFVNDSALQRAYSELPDSAFLIYEDIDTFFDGRTVIKGKVSFSTVLNCTDGALYKSGLITCFTTNHVEKLDPALMRAGRTDVIETIQLPGLQQVKEYLSLFYGAALSPLPVDIELRDSITMSAVQEICLRNKDNIGQAIRSLFVSSAITHQFLNGHAVPEIVKN
jgi:hypothetical protein